MQNVPNMTMDIGTSTAPLRVGVLGTGSLGKEHVRIYAELAAAGRIQLAGLFDTVAETARKFASKYQVRAFASAAEAAEACDAVSIVTPTTTHFELAKMLLQSGKHVLVEKPMTDDAAEAGELVKLAQQNRCVLQVGHVERFNPVFRYLQEVATDPRFIEVHRLSPYPARSTDIGVVLDLMIHDLDVVLAFVQSPVTSIDAVGIPVLSPSEDIANARLRFANGCVANLTASRISLKQMRKMRIFQPFAYISLDFLDKTAQIVQLFAPDAANLPPQDQLMEFDTPGGKKWLHMQMPETAPVNAIQRELETFYDSIVQDTTPVVSLSDGLKALDLAHRILKEVEKRVKIGLETTGIPLP